MTIKVFEGERVWQVRVSLPKNAEKNRLWATNVSVSVIAPTLERAVGCVREYYPDATVWGASHRGNDGTLLIDSELLDESRLKTA